MWERHRAATPLRGGARRGSGGERWCALRARPFDLSRLPSPVSRRLPCGSGILPRSPVAERRETRFGRRGVERPSGAAVRFFPVSRYPSPAHYTSGFLPRPPCGRGAGDGEREARGGARSARGLLIFPVSRHLSPVTLANVGNFAQQKPAVADGRRPRARGSMDPRPGPRERGTPGRRPGRTAREGRRGQGARSRALTITSSQMVEPASRRFSFARPRAVGEGTRAPALVSPPAFR